MIHVKTQEELDRVVKEEGDNLFFEGNTIHVLVLIILMVMYYIYVVRYTKGYE